MGNAFFLCQRNSYIHRTRSFAAIASTDLADPLPAIYARLLAAILLEHCHLEPLQCRDFFFVSIHY